MAWLPRATYALLVALLPATATVVGLVVLGQVPTLPEALGVGLVVAGVALHRARTGQVAANTAGGHLAASVLGITVDLSSVRGRHRRPPGSRQWVLAHAAR